MIRHPNFYGFTTQGFGFMALGFASKFSAFFLASAAAFFLASLYVFVFGDYRKGV